MSSIAEDEFYRQASLSQLLTGPDEQELAKELASFRPDAKEPVELVEASPELAGMLGSSVEFLDSRWDSPETSPPSTPTPPPATTLPTPSPLVSLSTEVEVASATGSNMDNKVDNKTSESKQHQGIPTSTGGSSPAAKIESKADASMWEPQWQGGKTTVAASPVKPDVTVSASMWEPQQPQGKNTGIANRANSDTKTDSSMWELPQRLRSKNADTVASPARNSDIKTGSSMWEQQRQGNKNAVITSAAKLDVTVSASTWEPQRLRSRNTGITGPANSDAKVDAAVWEPQRLRSKNSGIANPANSDTKGDSSTLEPQRLRSKNPAFASPANSDATVDAMWKRQHQGCKTSGFTTPINSGIQEPQRLRSKNAVTADHAKPNATANTNIWERQGTKSLDGNGAAPKREANRCDDQCQGGKVTKGNSVEKLDVKLENAAWQRNLGNVRVHIRDLGMRLGGVDARQEVKREQGKVTGKPVRVKARS